MAQASTTQHRNSFINGIVTDANEFAVPDNSALDMVNIDVLPTGAARKRRAMATTGSARTISTASGVTNPEGPCIRWEGAGQNRDTNLIAAQVGHHLAVYGAADIDLDSNYKTSIDLATVTGITATTIQAAHWKLIPGGDGSLFITTGVSKPVRLTYSTTGPTLTGELITVRIRDTFGLDDGLAIDEQITTLSDAHHYNLLNQGWDNAKISDYTNRSITGSPTTWVASTAYALNDLVVPTTANGYYYKVTNAGGGTSGASEPTWPTVIGDTVVDNTITWRCEGYVGTYPSNAQQWFQGRDSSGDFSPSALAQLDFGSAPAPKGRIIFDLDNQDYSTYVSGLSDLTLTKGFKLGVIYADRIFYLGFEDSLAPTWLSSTIFYSQVLSGDSSQTGDIPYAACYSVNDPSSEFFNTITSLDGGSIFAPALGRPLAVEVLGTSLFIFSDTGVWALNGGLGNSFTPDSPNLELVSSDKVIVGSSVVNADDELMAWTTSGIISFTIGSSPGTYVRTNRTKDRCQELFNSLRKGLSASNATRFPNGYYNKPLGIVEWDTYNSTDGETIKLRYNKTTQAFTKYSLGASIFRNGAVLTDDPDYADQLVYLKTYSSGSNALAQWFAFTGTGFLDFTTTDYSAYILTWAETFGEPHLRKQPVYLSTYMRKTEYNWVSAGTFDFPSGAQVTAYWDWSDSAVSSPKKTGPIDIYRHLRAPADPGSGYPAAYDYSPSVIVNKVKIRGSGNSVQFLFEAKSSKDFELLGWSLPMKVNVQP